MNTMSHTTSLLTKYPESLCHSKMATDKQPGCWQIISSELDTPLAWWQPAAANYLIYGSKCYEGYSQDFDEGGRQRLSKVWG